MLYIYDSVEIAMSIVMTAHHLGVKCSQVGSAVLIDKADYDLVVTETSAPKAAIVAMEQCQPADPTSNKGRNKLYKE